MKKLMNLALTTVFILGCSTEPIETDIEEGSSLNISAKQVKEQANIPVLTCGESSMTNLEVLVTAGETGAQGGFDLHWMLEAQFLETGWEGEFCELGFSGNGNDTYSLEAGESMTLALEDLMATTECGFIECGTAYVFRVRAKNEGGQGQQGGLNKSDWSENFICATESCACTYGKGYWRNHSNDNPGEQGNMWPVDELTLGAHTYIQEQLNTILDVPNNEGNNLVILSQHLIASKLNVAKGAGNEDIDATIAAADALIGNLVVLVDAFDDDQKELSESLKETLETFNESSPCDEEESEE